MLWMLLLLALGLSALWFGADSAERTEVSEEELLAQYGVAWQHNDPFAYLQASELAAARLSARAHTVPPARNMAHFIGNANSRSQE